MGKTSPDRRRHLRVPLVTEVESQASGVISPGRTENIGVGGLLVLCRQTFELETEVVVRFTLPSAGPIEAQGRVMHTLPNVFMGIEFLRLKEKNQEAIAEFVRQADPRE